MKARIAQWLDKHASPTWRNWHKLHSTWVSLFWFAFYGMTCAIYAFTGLTIVQEHPLIFTVMCMAATVTWGIARMTKQPGTDDVG
jgi:uncharacterized iron-regulated membrane protein